MKLDLTTRRMNNLMALIAEHKTILISALRTDRDNRFNNTLNAGA